MTNTPWLSVVIPVYQAEKSVSRAIASVTNQGVDGVEIICVDDCSPDNSHAVIEALRHNHPEIVLLRSETNQGPGPSRNIGLGAARGDYILFLDSDDILLEGSLEALRATTVAHSADLVLVGCEEVRRGKTRSLTDGPLSNLLSTLSPTTVEQEPRILFWPPAPWSKVYRRGFLEHHALAFGDGVAEDIPWSVQVTLLAQKVVSCQVPVYRYTTAATDSSVTTTSSEKNMAIVTQVSLMREHSQLHTRSPHIVRHLAALAAIHLIWPNRAAYRLIPDHLQEEFFDHSAKELTAWLAVSDIPPEIDSRPLMGAVDRTQYAQALAGGNWRRWQKTLQREAQRKAVRRFFRPGKVFGKK